MNLKARRVQPGLVFPEFGGVGTPDTCRSSSYGVSMPLILLDAVVPPTGSIGNCYDNAMLTPIGHEPRTPNINTLT